MIIIEMNNNTHASIFRSTLLSRPIKVGLKCPYIHTYTKIFFDFNESWHVGRGPQVMHDGMQYDLTLGQGHEPLKVGHSLIFKSYLLRHLQWALATDH